MGKRTERAGIVPFFINEDGECLMMFMMPSDEKYGGKVFQIAKGRIEGNDNPLETAVREAEEELGLTEDNIKWIRKCGVFLNTHHIYIAEVKTNNPSKFKDTDFETSETVWMNEDQIMSVGRKLHLPIIKKCIEKINSELSRN